MAVICRPQMKIGDVRIDLRRRDIAVTKQRLHRSRIGAMLQQMSREAVPQSVRRNILDARFFRMDFDHGPRNLSCERPPAMQENMWRSLFPILRFHRSVLLQPVNRALAKRHTSFLVSFSVTHNETCKQIDVSLFQTDQLRNAQSGGIHDFKHRTIAYSFFSRNVGRCEQAIDLVFSEKLWKITEALWRIEILSRVRLDVTVEHEKLEKTARCTDRASNRRRRQTLT